MKAIELGTWAPNGGNHQNWKFIVVTKKKVIHEMADAVQSQVEMIASWPEASRFGETVERWKKNSDFFRHAPVCIAVLMGNYDSVADQKQPDGKTSSQRTEKLAEQYLLVVQGRRQQQRPGASLLLGGDTSGR